MTETALQIANMENEHDMMIDDSISQNREVPILRKKATPGQVS